jgi:UDP-GlcNAc:undecaprenyl-phosphate GlcNAc-1-phosphate transferase
MSFLIALALALLLTPLARRVGIAAGLVDRPGHPLKIHAEPVPVLGGVAVTGATFAALALAGHWPATAVAAAAALLVAGGLIDDARQLPPAALVLLQVAAAAVLVSGAFEIGAAGALGLFVLVFACTNAVNLIDGQDGLAGGLGAIGALGLAALLAGDSSPDAALGLALAGALAGFLAWNLPPARIFLGNGGAYAAGAILAVLAAMVVDADGARGIVPALLCLGVFLFDLAFTVARRIGSGALASGDRLHSYDLLSVEFGSRGKATLAFCGAEVLAVGLALIADGMPPAAAVVTAVTAASAAALWGWRLWSRSGHARRARRGLPRSGRPAAELTKGGR